MSRLAVGIKPPGGFWEKNPETQSNSVENRWKHAISISYDTVQRTCIKISTKQLPLLGFLAKFESVCLSPHKTFLAFVSSPILGDFSPTTSLNQPQDSKKNLCLWWVRIYSALFLKIGKKKLFSSHQGLNPHSCIYPIKAKPFNQSLFHDKSNNSRSLSSHHASNI